MSFTRQMVLTVKLILILLLSGSSVQAQPAPSIENDPNYKHFKGSDGSRLRGADPAFAKEVVDVVMNYPGIDFDLPKLDNGKIRCFVETDKTSLIDGNPFEQLMIHAVDPDSQINNEYVKLVAPLLPALNARVIASNKELTPAEVLRMCLDICKGNYPKATLLAHNYTKNITYKGRQEYKKLAVLIKMGRPFKFSAQIGTQASKLVTMRTTPDEKMGIYYHSFVPLAIAAWAGFPGAADTAIVEEYRVRSAAWLKQKIPNSIGQFLPDMGSPPDGEKKQSDLQFAEAAREIHRRVSARPRIVVCDCSVTPESGPLSTKFKVKLNYQIQGIAYGAEPVIEENMKVTAPEFSRELVNELKQIPITDSFNVKKEFDFDPEVEGQHLLEFSFKGGKGGIDADGNKPFQVGTAKTGSNSGFQRSAPQVEKNLESGRYGHVDVQTTEDSISFTTNTTSGTRTSVLTHTPFPLKIEPDKPFTITAALSGASENEMMASIESGYGFVLDHGYDLFVDTTHPNSKMTLSTPSKPSERQKREMFVKLKAQVYDAFYNQTWYYNPAAAALASAAPAGVTGLMSKTTPQKASLPGPTARPSQQPTSVTKKGPVLFKRTGPFITQTRSNASDTQVTFGDNEITFTGSDMNSKSTVSSTIKYTPPPEQLSLGETFPLSITATGHEDQSPLAMFLVQNWIESTTPLGNKLVSLSASNCAPSMTATCQVIDFNKKLQDYKKAHPEKSAQIDAAAGRLPGVTLSVSGRVLVKIEWKYVRK